MKDALRTICNILYVGVVHLGQFCKFRKEKTETRGAVLFVKILKKKKKKKRFDSISRRKREWRVEETSASFHVVENVMI